MFVSVPEDVSWLALSCNGSLTHYYFLLPRLQVPTALWEAVPIPTGGSHWTCCPFHFPLYPLLCDESLSTSCALRVQSFITRWTCQSWHGPSLLKDFSCIQGHRLLDVELLKLEENWASDFILPCEESSRLGKHKQQRHLRERHLCDWQWLPVLKVRALISHESSKTQGTHGVSAQSSAVRVCMHTGASGPNWSFTVYGGRGWFIWYIKSWHQRQRQRVRQKGAGRLHSAACA